MAKGTKQNNVKQPLVICRNRRAPHDYAIDERLEAGLVLTGTEVKSCRAGKAHVNDAYVAVIRGEAYLVGGHIAEYEPANRFNHEPGRNRKLLLHQREIERLSVRLHERGMTAVPMALYFREGRVKLEIGIGRGKSKIDKRDDIKDREMRVELARVLRRTSQAKK